MISCFLSSLCYSWCKALPINLFHIPGCLNHHRVEWARAILLLIREVIHARQLLLGHVVAWKTHCPVALSSFFCSKRGILFWTSSSFFVFRCLAVFGGVSCTRNASWSLGSFLVFGVSRSQGQTTTICATVEGAPRGASIWYRDMTQTPRAESHAHWIVR